MHRISAILEAEGVNFNASVQRELGRLQGRVYDLASYVTSSGGKRIRPLLTLLSGRVLGCTHPDLYALGTAVEFLHSASLMHDDILDSARTRRGRPAAHTVFGVTDTVLSGDVLCALAVKIVSELGDTRLSVLLADALANTASGQVEELAGLHSLDADFKKYMGIITGKTAWLLRCSCAMGALRAGASQDIVDAMAEFGLELGRAFQLVDDALDIAPEDVTGKPAGGDLREGKFTPPLRFYFEGLSGQAREDFTAGFTSGSFTDEAVSRHLAAMREQGCDTRTRAMAEEHLAKAGNALKLVPEGPGFELLSALPEYIQKRNR